MLENVLLGAEGGFLLKKGADRARKELMRLEQEYALEVDVDAKIADLPVGIQQRVEILKALFRGAHVLILDEPTGVLTPQEADHLFRILDNLRSQGRTVILITHKLREIMAATDNVSVMRRGEMVAHRETSKTSTEELAELMVGRKVLLEVNKAPAQPREPVLEVSNLNVVDELGVRRVKDVSFNVRAGEILGVAGVAGNGQSQLLNAIAGIIPIESGSISIRGFLSRTPRVPEPIILPMFQKTGCASVWSMASQPTRMRFWVIKDQANTFRTASFARGTSSIPAAIGWTSMMCVPRIPS